MRHLRRRAVTILAEILLRGVRPGGCQGAVCQQGPEGLCLHGKTGGPALCRLRQVDGPGAGGKKYCSDECNRLGTRALQREYRERTAPKQERYCQICGIRIEGAGRKYCGNCAGAVKYEKPEGYWKKYNLKRGEKAREAAFAAFENQEDGA